MSTAAIERRAIREAVSVAPALAITASAAFLLARTLPDISGKPWHEDEAVAGLISAQPLGDVLHTVVLDRGGAPLHFLLTHLAFAVDGSPHTLRWLSLLFAVATIPLCYDLARRLASGLAGVLAAALAATSQLLAVYATFGRMYSLFAFVSALALDLFVRAVDRPTRGTVITAVTAGLLPIAVHPFGVFLAGAELAVAVWLWQFRVIAAGLLGLPLVIPYLRLPGRYDPGVGMTAPEAALRALAGSAGGYGIGLALFAVLAGIGAWALPRSFAAVGVLAVATPATTLGVLGSEELSPRHWIFVLPIWITFVAAGAARVPARILVASALVAIAALAPAAVSDPRTTPSGVAAPADWLRAQLEPGDVLYPYSPLFLAALPEAAKARALPREPQALARALRRTDEARRVFVAIPLREPLRRHVPGAHAFRSWLILEERGPFSRVPQLLARIAPILKGTSAYASVQQLRGAACGC